ncbi:MAG: glycosyl transferase family 2, partial [Pseudomonadota bacterium]
ATRRGRKPTLRNKVLQMTLKALFNRSVSDVFCRTRVAKRSVLEEVSAFGVRQHFLPTIAAELGHTIKEIEVDPAPETQEGSGKFVFKPIGHIRALFDALSLYVVLKFLRRPLRFFGAVGLPIFLIGAFTTLLYLVMRITGDWALADRPGLIFAVMMVVLGLQIIALGLVGEIIIFANSRRMKQFKVQTVIRGEGDKSGK